MVTGIPCGSDCKESACNVGHPGSIPGLGRSPGEGNGNSYIPTWEQLHIHTHTHTHTHTIYTERKKVDTRKNFLTSICQNVVKAFLWEVHP